MFAYIGHVKLSPSGLSCGRASYVQAVTCFYLSLVCNMLALATILSRDSVLAVCKLISNKNISHIICIKYKILRLGHQQLVYHDLTRFLYNQSFRNIRNRFLDTLPHANGSGNTLDTL